MSVQGHSHYGFERLYRGSGARGELGPFSVPIGVQGRLGLWAEMGKKKAPDAANFVFGELAGSVLVLGALSWARLAPRGTYRGAFCFVPIGVQPPVA